MRKLHRLWLNIKILSLFFIAISLCLAPLIPKASSAVVGGKGDRSKINISVHTYPDVDRYGMPTVNPDGSLFPNDKLWVEYRVYNDSDVELKGIEAIYDTSAFDKIFDEGWGSLSGRALFRVKVSATPKNYTFTIRAYGENITQSAWAIGTVKVTYGGVDVKAHYMAVYKLMIATGGNGTTDPEPGGYWFKKGASVYVKAIPDPNFTIAYWLLDGKFIPGYIAVVVKMDAPHNLTAFFSPTNSSTTTSSALTPSVADGASVKPLGAQVLAGTPKLAIEGLTWTTWYDFFRGTVCQAKGYLYVLGGGAVPNSDVVVEFLKMNAFTGAKWVSAKVVKTGRNGFFIIEDTCLPVIESFLGVEAWAEKAGYLPSWSLSIEVDPTSDEVGQGESFIGGVYVKLYGRYTPVPIGLYATNVPQGCSVKFDPPGGNVSRLNPFEGAVLIKPLTTTFGNYSIYIHVQSGLTSSTALFSLAVVSPIKSDLSGVRFSATGLDPDLNDAVLVLDGNTTLNTTRLPYTAFWNVGSNHTYRWLNIIKESRMFILESVEVESRYVTTATVEVEVAKYDPQFTVVLAYTVPDSAGKNSYEKPFTFIIRYDGNGPEKDLGKRAVFEGWSWYAYASKVVAEQQLTGIADISNMKPEDFAKNLEELQKLLNFTKGVTFSAAGIDAETSGKILTVDGEDLSFNDLPKTYNWSEGTVHAYEWSARMPVLVWDYQSMVMTEASDEWFSFTYALLSQPQLSFQPNLNMTQEELLRQALGFMAKLKSPSGSVNVTALGNRVTGVYSHDKLLDSIASSAGVAHDDTLKCIEPIFPVFFSNDSRYAKFVFALDDRVAAQALKEGWNSSICYEIAFSSSLFTPHTFKANYTCDLCFFEKPVNATVYKWIPKKWLVDTSVRVEAMFDLPFNFTEMSGEEAWLRSMTDDETALKMALEDLYECPPQYFAGFGSFSDVMKKTSPYYYRLNVTVGHGTYTIGSIPQDLDAWTEKLKTKESWWSSPKSTLSEDFSRKTAGSASIKVSGESLGAILGLVRYVETTPLTTLSFNIYLGDGCTGDITVYMLSKDGAMINVSRVIPKWSWQTVEIPVRFVEEKIVKVGIYAVLSSERGEFWVDRLYFEKAMVWRWADSHSFERLVLVDFSTDKPYPIYVNLDPTSPLSVNVTRDVAKSCDLLINAVPQLGGLKNVTVYKVVSAPTGYELANIPLDKLEIVPIKTEVLLYPESNATALLNSTEYVGLFPMHETYLGYFGNASMIIIKDPSMKALPGYNKTLLLVEAENVWGTKFRAVVAVEPYSLTFWELMFEELAKYIMLLVIAAIIVSLIIYFVKGETRPLFRL